MKSRLVLFVAVAVLSAAAQAPKPAAGNAQPVLTRPAAAQPDQSQLPVGTALRMKLETPLSTTRNKSGDRFAGRVIEAVTLNGRQVIPVGASVEGHVTGVSEPRRIHGTPTLDLQPETVILPNGDRLTLVASLVDTSYRPDTEVNEEGELKGRGHDSRDVKELAIGGAGGTILGAVIGGGMKGALIGGGVGATAAITHWLIRRRSVDVPAGTELIMELSRPMSISPAAIHEGGQ